MYFNSWWDTHKFGGIFYKQVSCDFEVFWESGEIFMICIEEVSYNSQVIHGQISKGACGVCY